MSAILGSLRRLIKLFEENSIPYMVTGGYALPFYGRVRATVDVDLAVSITGDKGFDHLLASLREASFEPTICSPRNPLIIVVDRKKGTETEIWLRPDGIFFDDETLRRRRKAELGRDLSAWIVSAEDFIVSKLARPDRGAVDEQDVKSVLVRQGAELDTEYLQKRAKQAGVLAVLQAIQAS